MKKSIGLLAFLFLMIFSAMAQDFETAVREAVKRQMTTYPESTLKDLYKNFFQDKYGPGHMVADTTAAGSYIRRELSTMQHSDGALFEPTGWEGNFYRVNLSLLKDGRIPYDRFFDAFVRSVNSIDPPSVEIWAGEWKRIETIIRSMSLNLPDYEPDLQEIETRLQEGDFVGHHSEAFEKAYSPHYRIMSREIVEKELFPLLKE